MLRKTLLAIGLSLLILPGCEDKGTLERSQVETVTVGGRKFEVRIAPTANQDEYAMLIVRGTMVINADPERELARAQEVAERVMVQTCKGRRHEEIISGLHGNVNYRTLFRCK